MVSASPGCERLAVFTFFMFTAYLRPADPEYRKVIVGHIRELTTIGYGRLGQLMLRRYEGPFLLRRLTQFPPSTTRCT